MRKLTSLKRKTRTRANLINPKNNNCRTQYTKEELLHWIENNPVLIQNTLIMMMEKDDTGEGLVRAIFDYPYTLLPSSRGWMAEENRIQERLYLEKALDKLWGASYDKGDEVDPEDIPPQLSEADRAIARNEDNN